MRVDSFSGKGDTPLSMNLCLCRLFGTIRCHNTTVTEFAMTADIEKDHLDFNPGDAARRHSVIGDREAVYSSFRLNDCGSSIFIQNKKTDDRLLYFQ